MSPDGCPSALGQPSPRTVCPGWGNPKPKGLRRRDTIDSPLAVLICASFSVYSPSVSKHEGDDAIGPPMSPCSGQPPTDAQLRPAPPCPTHCTHACLPSSNPLQIPVASQDGTESLVLAPVYMEVYRNSQCGCPKIASKNSRLESRPKGSV